MDITTLLRGAPVTLLGGPWPSGLKEGAPEPFRASPGEQGDAGGNCKTPVEWSVLCICHSNRRSPRMRVKLQLVMCNDQGEAETVTDVITLNKNHQHIEHLGLTLAES